MWRFAGEGIDATIGTKAKSSYRPGFSSRVNARAHGIKSEAQLLWWSSELAPVAFAGRLLDEDHGRVERKQPRPGAARGVEAKGRGLSFRSCGYRRVESSFCTRDEGGGSSMLLAATESSGQWVTKDRYTKGESRRQGNRAQTSSDDDDDKRRGIMRVGYVQ